MQNRADPMNDPRHPWRQRLTAVSLLAIAAGGAWLAAGEATDRIETQARADASAALAAGGFDWAQAEADGLSLILTGTAPDEVQRYRAVSTAGTVVDAGRIVDRTRIAPQTTIAPPPFRLEILRHDQGVSVIGLAPATLDRRAMLARLGGAGDAAAASAPAITDLVDLADYPAPPHWDAAVEFALTAASLVPRGKISVGPEGVQVAAVTDGPAEQARLEQALQAARPDGIALTTDITAPRPVIAPFVLALDKTGGGLRMTACAADTAAARDRITAALADAGLPGQPDCTLGLGAPSPQWADAAVPVIAALAALPAGRAEIRDTDITLTAPALVPPGQFAAARDTLRAALPRLFTLTATLERAQVAAPPGPAAFSASKTPEGVTLDGSITDDRMRGAVESFAVARFGQTGGDLAVNPALPAGWSLRVIGALDALAALDRGTAEMTPDLIRVVGTTGDRNAAQAIAATLAARIGAGAEYELSLRYDPRLDPGLDLPSGTDCVDRLNETMQQSEIGFEPNRAVIAGDPADTLARLADIMSECADFRLEIGGHTDSQGSDSFNMTLSHDRAKAVATAMAEAGIATANLTVTGYGETRPVGDNATEAGREMNRRIEFRLLSPDPVNATPGPVTVTRGTTRAGETAETGVAPVGDAGAEGRGGSDGDAVDGGAGAARAAQAGAAVGAGDAAAGGADAADARGDGAAAGAGGPEGAAAPRADSPTAVEDSAQAGPTAVSAATAADSAGDAGQGGGGQAVAAPKTAAADTPDPAASVPEMPAPAAPAAAGTGLQTPAAPLRPGYLQSGRLTGLPPDLGGEAVPELPAPAAVPVLVPVDPDAARITADDVAAADGISIRPDAPQISGDRLLTPVPPILPTGIPAAPPTSPGPARPSPRPGG